MPIRIKVREVAKKRGLGQSRLSRKADMDLHLVQRVFSNPYTNITLLTLERLARALEVEPGELLELDPPLERKEQETGQREENEDG